MLEPPKDALAPCVGIRNGLILALILWAFIIIYLCV